MRPNYPYTESIHVSPLIPNYNDPNLRLNLQLNLQTWYRLQHPVIGTARWTKRASRSICRKCKWYSQLLRNASRLAGNFGNRTTRANNRIYMYLGTSSLITTRVSSREIYIFYREGEFLYWYTRRCVCVCVCVCVNIYIHIYISASRSASGAYLGCDDWATRLR